MTTEREVSDSKAEWLCANRRGSFALGCVDRIPRRKYHSLLTVREPGFGESLDVVAEVGEALILGSSTHLLHELSFGDVHDPHGTRYAQRFTHSPRASWTYEVDGVHLDRSVSLAEEEDAVRLHYRVANVPATGARLGLRPMLRCRPLHALTRRNPFLNGALAEETEGYSVRPYPNLSPVHIAVRGIASAMRPDALWIERVHYDWERARGYDFVEDLYSPGELLIDLSGDASFDLWLAWRRLPPPDARCVETHPGETFASELEAAADAYLVELDAGGPSVVVGYPWFGEWARDALLSLPGLCLARGKTDDALGLLEGLADRRERGLIPNIPAGVQPANLDSVDASLLFVRAVELTQAAGGDPDRVGALLDVGTSIIDAIADGADARVSVDEDGALFVAPGPWALTWMDAIVDGTPSTPRNGFAVDLNALLLHALRYLVEQRPGSRFSRRWGAVADRAGPRFVERFWLPEQEYLADAHDGERPDASLRPNQLWAVVLRTSPLDAAQKRAVVAAVRHFLLTPLGLRTLAPNDPAYVGHYRGGQAERDAAYHQGTVWPWLLGLYGDAVIQAEGVEAARAELAPILNRLERHLSAEACLGQVSEVFDAEAPHAPGGSPAQAWSVAELLRLVRTLENEQ